MNKTLIVLLLLVSVLAVGYFLFNYQQPEEKEKPEGEMPEEETMVVKVYFSNSQKDPQALHCEEVYPVERYIPKTVAVIRAALEELLKGPNDIEIEQGCFTSINQGVEVQSLAVEDGVAKIDLNTQLEYQVGGSCRVQAIRAQITETLKQFPEVQEVIISIDGRIEDILQP